MRTIHLNDEGIASHLIALIHEQQKMALIHQEYLPEGKKNALFAYRRKILDKGVWRDKNIYALVIWPYVSYQFKEICKRHGMSCPEEQPHHVPNY